MNGAGLARAAGAVALITIASRILGFLREMSLAAVFGATYATDALELGVTISHVLFATISYALTTTFIPAYSNVREQHGREAGFRFANTVIWAVLYVAMVFVIAGEALAEQLVALVAPGLDEPVAELTEYLTRILFPMMIFQLLSGIASGILNAEGEFKIPTLADLGMNVGVIVSIIIFGSRYGIVPVAAGTLVGTALGFAVKVPALARTGFRWMAVFDLRDPSLRRMALMTVPAILVAGAQQVNTMVDRMLASTLPEGRIAALSYAHFLMQLAPGIVGLSVTTVVYPTLAQLIARKEWRRFSDSLVRYLSHLQFLLMPIAAGTLVLRESLVRIVYERGAFDAAATHETAWALLFLSFGILVIPMQGLVSRVFFALQDTWTPFVLGVITVGVNIVLNLLLIGPLEQGGLALASVVAISVGLGAGLVALRRKTQSTLRLRPFFVSFAKTACASVIMAVIVAWVHLRLGALLRGEGALIELVRVAVSAIAGVAIYVAVVWTMKVPELSGAIAVAQSLARGGLRRSVGSAD